MAHPVSLQRVVIVESGRALSISGHPITDKGDFLGVVPSNVQLELLRCPALILHRAALSKEAFIRFPPGMRQSVRLQMVLSAKPFRASSSIRIDPVTLKVLDAQMDLHMLRQARFLRKLLVAFLAFMRPSTIMNLQMRSQVGFLREPVYRQKYSSDLDDTLSVSGSCGSN